MGSLPAKIGSVWGGMVLLLALHPGALAAQDDPYGTQATSAPSAAAAQAGQGGEGKESCEERWRRYRESVACFAPYRLVNGGVKAEAYRHCKEVKQPEFCK